MTGSDYSVQPLQIPLGTWYSPTLSFGETQTYDVQIPSSQNQNPGTTMAISREMTENQTKKGDQDRVHQIGGEKEPSNQKQAAPPLADEWPTAEVSVEVSSPLLEVVCL
jgi:hypothetical protein